MLLLPGPIPPGQVAAHPLGYLREAEAFLAGEDRSAAAGAVTETPPEAVSGVAPETVPGATPG